MNKKKHQSKRNQYENGRDSAGSQPQNSNGRYEKGGYFTQERGARSYGQDQGRDADRGRRSESARREDGGSPNREGSGRNRLQWDEEEGQRDARRDYGEFGRSRYAPENFNERNGGRSNYLEGSDRQRGYEEREPSRPRYANEEDDGRFYSKERERHGGEGEFRRFRDSERQEYGNHRGRGNSDYEGSANDFDRNPRRGSRRMESLEGGYGSDWERDSSRNRDAFYDKGFEQNPSNQEKQNRSNRSSSKEKGNEEHSARSKRPASEPKKEDHEESAERQSGPGNQMEDDESENQNVSQNAESGRNSSQTEPEEEADREESSSIFEEPESNEEEESASYNENDSDLNSELEPSEEFSGSKKKGKKAS